MGCIEVQNGVDMASVALDPGCGILPDIFVVVGGAHLDAGWFYDGEDKAETRGREVSCVTRISSATLL